jgi:hypothetical protein
MQRNQLQIGDVFFLSGKPTRVRILGNVNGSHPKVEIVWCGERSKFTEGQITYISRRQFYRTQRKYE